VEQRGVLEPALEEAFATLPAQDWLDRLETARIPCGAVNEMSDVAEHPQLAHNGLVVEVSSPAGPIPVIGSPFLVDGERPPSGPVPALGEHTDEILRELGLAGS
jgi:crotonobetainyl-CoA:carnitine CoA-transferase CaiB-like acyl-CoA transferase